MNFRSLLDLLEREVSEFCEEFTRLSDEALIPLARFEFRSIAPKSSLEQRTKAAVDRAATRTLWAGSAAAIGSGAAIQAGVISATVVASAAAAPVGVAILGVIAAAGVWKAFASPSERKKKDIRERTLSLEESLRELMMANLPRFEKAVDDVVERYTAGALPDICSPRVEAARIREIATSYTIVAKNVREAADARIQKALLQIEGTCE